MEPMFNGLQMLANQEEIRSESTLQYTTARCQQIWRKWLFVSVLQANRRAGR